MPLIKLKNIFFLLGILITIISLGLVLYLLINKDLINKEKISETNSEKTYNLKTTNETSYYSINENKEDSLYPMEIAGYKSIADFYREHKNSDLKVRYAKPIETTGYLESPVLSKIELGEINKEEAKVLNYTEEMILSSDWTQNYAISYDGSFFVAQGINPSTNNHYLVFYDFNENKFYNVENTNFSKRMNQILTEGLARPEQLGATLFFNPSLEYIAVTPLHQVIAYNSIWSIFVFKIDKEKEKLTLTYQKDFPNSEYIKIKGWDPVNETELHIAQYESYSPYEGITSFKSETGKSIYFDAANPTKGLKPSTKNDLESAWYNLYISDDFKDSYEPITNNSKTQEYIDFKVAVFEDFYLKHDIEKTIYPLDISFSEGVNLPRGKDQAP